LDCFAPRTAFHAIGVEHDGQLVAALPLVGRRIRRLLPVADLTWNYWSPNGEFLLDPSADIQGVLDLLIDQLRRAGWPLLWFEMVPVESPWWHALLEHFNYCRWAFDVHARYKIGQVEIRGPFEAYLAARPRQQFRSLQKDLRRLQRSGPVTLRVLADLTPDEVEAPLRQAFQLEQRSWRTQSGATVLGTPGLFEFYRHQARQLAAWRQLRLVFLEHQGQPIAFEVGWTAKGVYHSFKVGYDQQYRRASPGHLLRMLLLEHLFQQSDVSLVDFQGPLTDAMAVWSTREYPIARVVAARTRWGSRAMLAGYQASAHLVRSLRTARQPNLLSHDALPLPPDHCYPEPGTSNALPTP
jgi:hypothetical protein